MPSPNGDLEQITHDKGEPHVHGAFCSFLTTTLQAYADKSKGEQVVKIYGHPLCTEGLKSPSNLGAQEQSGRSRRSGNWGSGIFWKNGR